MAEQNNLGLARRGRKMKYYPAIHCQLFDGATRQKKASPWALSLWMNLAAVKLHFFFSSKMGCAIPPGEFEGFFFWYFFVSTWTIYFLTVPKKKSHPKRSDFDTKQPQVISEPLKVELAFDALAIQKIPPKNLTHKIIKIKHRYKHVHDVSDVNLQSCKFSMILVILVKFH